MGIFIIVMRSAICAGTNLHNRIIGVFHYLKSVKEV